MLRLSGCTTHCLALSLSLSLSLYAEDAEKTITKAALHVALRWQR